ncbi:MAG: SURF1 family protein [Candidatus Thioglobus sp.]|nr:SURF1 family protein [Candidatus Thioglobus sp.]
MRREFALPAVLIALTLWGLLALGFWQLDRAEEKRQIENEIIKAQNTTAEPPKNIESLLKKQHHQVLLDGHFDSNKQFIYDNQIVNSTAGYYILTPFVLHKKTAILVNRGFVAWHGNRQKLADIKIQNQPRRIKVKLIKPLQRIEFKPTLETDFPLLIQSLDLEQLSKLSGYQILPLLGQLDAQEKDGFYRKWQPFYGSVDKHLGYALQWFLMALVLFFIALRLLFKFRVTGLKI